MAGVGWIELGIILFVLGLGLGLGYLALRPLLHRSRRRAEIPEHPDAPVHQRPIWVVVLLTILTLGFYLFIWFGQSWSDLKRGVGNLDRSPSSHLWAMATGFDFFARVRAHFQTINDHCASRNLPAGVGPRAAITMITIVLLIPVLVANGQRSLNRIWEHDFGAASRRTASAGEWVAIIALGLMYAPVVILNSGAA